MPLVARDDSLLTVIDLQPRFWGERLHAEDKRCAEEAARRAAWLAAAAHALGIPAVITEEDPEMNGSTDEAVLAPLRAGAPVFTKTVFGLADCPEIMRVIHGDALCNKCVCWRHAYVKDGLFLERIGLPHSVQEKQAAACIIPPDSPKQRSPSYAQELKPASFRQGCADGRRYSDCAMRSP